MGSRRRLAETVGKVLALKPQMPDRVILPAHNPTAAAPARHLTQETTMQTFENTVTIHRPGEEVFVFLADFENIPAWNYAIEDPSKTSAGPVGGQHQVPPDPLHPGQ